jgi:hypothetical protein
MGNAEESKVPAGNPLNKINSCRLAVAAESEGMLQIRCLVSI